jgi:vancomycin resistance protein VanW
MLVRRVVPYRVRLALVNLRGLPRWMAESRTFALPRLEPAERDRFGFTLAGHASPLERVPGALPPELQRGKQTNVRLASDILDGTLIRPGETFSYHHALGRPSRRRGFRPGLELRDGRPSRGTGGGLCQISNGLHWTAVQAGMEIVERHRHGLDLFPDHQRTVPFGCGATVLWRHTDLRIRNPLPVPVLLRTRVEGGAFRCELRTETDPGIRVEVREEQHRFFRVDGGWMRENRIRRRITRTDATLIVDEEVAHNRGRVLYEPSPEQTSC